MMAIDDPWAPGAAAGPFPAGEGCAQLATLARHAVVAPLRQAQAALALGRHRPGQAQMGALFDSLDGVLSVVGTLAELADAFAASEAGDERVELWPLLQAAWSDLEPVARSHGVSLRLRAPDDLATRAAVHGSERWLRGLFRECLAWGVGASPRGSTLDLLHHQADDRAVLTLSGGSTGAAAGHRPARLGVAGVDVAGSPLGRALAEQVARLHGGALHLHSDGPLRRLVIELPTGAARRAKPSPLA